MRAVSRCLERALLNVARLLRWAMQYLWERLTEFKSADDYVVALPSDLLLLG